MTQPVVTVCVSDSEMPYPKPVAITVWDLSQDALSGHLTYAETTLLAKHLQTALSVMDSLGLKRDDD